MPLFLPILNFWKVKIRAYDYDFRIWRRKFKILDIGRVTKFSKKQNEQKISDLNLIKNATIYRHICDILTHLWELISEL